MFPALPSATNAATVKVIQRSQLQPLPASSVTAFPEEGCQLAAVATDPSQDAPQLTDV